MRPKCPIYVGYHICDPYMTQKFKQLFTATYANPTKETLGDLFGNPVLESTELVSSALSILKCWEFRHYF